MADVVYDTKGQGYSIAYSKQTSYEKLTGKLSPLAPYVAKAKKKSSGQSSRGGSGSSPESSGGSGSSPTSPVISQMNDVQETISGTSPSPQETIRSTGSSPSLIRNDPRDVIEVGPGGVNAPGAITREEAIRTSGRRTVQQEPIRQEVIMPEWWEPSGTEVMTDYGGMTMVPDKPVVIDIPKPQRGGRIISDQETVSVESEAQRIAQEKAGRDIINMPAEQGRQISEFIVGPLENVPKTETAARGITAAIEFGLTLPGETLRSHVSTTELVQDLVAKDVITSFDLPGPTNARLPTINIQKAGEYAQKEFVAPILSDPAGAGVKAGLGAALIVLPAAKFIGSRVKTMKSGKTTRTSPSYEVTDSVPSSTRVNMLSDIVYEPMESGIKARGSVKVSTKASKSLLDVSAKTVQEGEAFKTIVEARKVSTSKMDLLTGEEFKGTILTKELPDQISVSKSVFGGEELARRGGSAQLDLLGKSRPTQEAIFRGSAERALSDTVDVGIGGTEATRSILNFRPRQTVEIFGRELLMEERTGAKTRRVTATREAVIDPSAFEDFLSRRRGAPKDLGLDQDTLRSFNIEPRSSGSGVFTQTSRDVAIAERSIGQAIQAFSKTRPPTSQSPARTGLVPSARVSQVRGSKPPSPGPLLLKGKTLEDEIFVRYPPSEAPKMAREGSLNVVNTPMELGGMAQDIGDMIGSGQVIRGRRGSSNRIRITEDLSFKQDADLSMDQVQVQRQDLGLRTVQATKQRTRQVKALNIPEFRPIETSRSRVPRLNIRNLRTPIGGAVIPPIEPSLGPASKSMFRKIGKGIDYSYRPTLAGIASGRSLGRSPGAVSGLEIRPPVRRKKKRRKFI